MNKLFIGILSVTLLLSACGKEQTFQSWEEEEVVESDRILTDDVNVIWNLGDGSGEAKAGEDTLVQLEIVNRDDKPIETFDITHEKLLHLMVISKDLSYFNHIHPEYKGNGIFEINNNFPAGGEYKVVADFKPTEGGSMTKMDWVQIGGDSKQPAPIEVDTEYVETVDGVRVTLDPGGLKVNEELTLKFTLEDEATNEPITDLEPYLGAIGHVVVLSENGEQYLHVHAVEGQGSGPDAKFEATFPKSGVYKVWGQFQRNGQVFTVSYIVNVP